VPLVAFAVWLVAWRAGFEAMDNGFGLTGLAIAVFVVAAWRLHPEQYFGWQWGKFVKPVQASRFHLVMVLSTADPIQLTEYSIVLAAAALPLTYLPVLIVANDRDYMGDKVNSRAPARHRQNPGSRACA
jgi:hypothetical protein